MPIITVTGKVASSIATQTGKGIIKIWEKSDFRGQEKFVLWTCWFDTPQAQVTELDEITINGRLSTKIGTYTAKTGEEKTAVEHHINDSLIQAHHAAETRPEPQPFANLEDVPF